MRAFNYTLLALLLLPGVTKAQARWDWGLWAGGANYLGDLVENKYPEPSETNLAGGLNLSYYFGYRWALRTSAAYAQISGDDHNFEQPVYQQVRNVRFSSQLGELSTNILWEPFGKRRYPGGGQHRLILSPYIFAGIGAVYVKTAPDYSAAPREGIIQRVEKDMASPRDFIKMTTPLGAGIKWDVSKRSSLELEAGIRRTPTDYLDGVSVAGNPQNNDWYVFGGLTWSLRFGERDYDRDLMVDKIDACPRVPGVASARGCPDADGDSVEDLEDACPEEFGKRELGGCPDGDGDGIMDKIDACPEVPGLAALQGCPDTDGDGITDKEDACPEVAGLAWLHGCPDPDFDADGVPDRLDACPDLAGDESCNGCPYLDTDNDGVADADDHCPALRGDPTLQGCPDQDGDRVPDYRDKCPDLAGDPRNEGCPMMAEEVKKVLNFATRNVQFETGSAVLKKSSFKVLDQVAGILATYDYYAANIEGHTDSRGNDKANLTLSGKRAKVCLEYLVRKGIARERLHSKGYGEAKPIASNKKEKGRRLNRRVEFKLFIE